MTPEQEAIKKEWLTDLRSGQHKQGRNFLHVKRQGEPDTFCCLGRLCDIAVRAGVIPEPVEIQQDGYSFMTYGSGLNTNSKVLPIEVVEWAGLQHEGGMYKTGTLSFDNDSGMRFNRIADLIESNPTGLYL